METTKLQCIVTVLNIACFVVVVVVLLSDFTWF